MNDTTSPTASRTVRPVLGKTGLSVGKFKLLRLIGAGGFGEVWRAQEEIQGKPVGPVCAVKLMRLRAPTTGSSDEEALKNGWVQEINALRSINHWAIPKTRDGGIDSGTGYAFIAMELLEGETLADRLSRGCIGWRRVMMIAERVASALDAAHARGVIHCDLKPQNVFLGEHDRVFVIDWGIARSVSAPNLMVELPEHRTHKLMSTSLSSTANETSDFSTQDQMQLARAHRSIRPRMVGTPGYMAPELLCGDAATPAADAYALGVVLYQCMTGQLPYRISRIDEETESTGHDSAARRTDVSRIWDATLRGDLIPIGEVVPNIPSGVGDLVKSLLSEDPKKRGSEELLQRVADVHRFPDGVPNPPYAGLDAFSAERSGFLFGRDAHIDRIVARLERETTIVLSGPSGCGKSSLAIAGVAPRLDRMLFGGTDGWRLRVVRPSELQALEPCANGPLPALAQEKRGGRQPPYGTVVVVDQLEEVLGLEGASREAFCMALANLAARSGDVLVLGERISADVPVRVLATVREDFEWQVVRIDSLRNLCETSRCLVTGVDAAAARELVEEPAKALGYALEGLQEVVREVETLLARDPTALPIVQFALTEWWKLRNENTKVLYAADWKAFGGVEGALSDVADRYYQELSYPDKRVLRELFGRLLIENRKQWVEASSLKTKQERRLMDELVNLRLVRHREENEGRGGYELAHESLAQRWDVLCQWISEREAEDALIADLEMEAKLWARQGRPESRLRLGLLLAP